MSLQVIDEGQVFATGEDTCTAYIAPKAGMISNKMIWFDSIAAGTITIDRATQVTTANVAEVAGTALTIDTPSGDGTVGGAVLTTSDFVLVHDSAAAGSGWQRSAITTVPAGTTTVALTTTSNVTLSAGDPVYIVRAANIVSVVTADETIREENAFVGYRQMPVALTLAATGTCKISCVYEVKT